MGIVSSRDGGKPLFERTCSRNRNLVMGMIFMIVIGISTMAPMALLPPMLQQLFGYPVIDTGMMMAPRGVGVLMTHVVRRPDDGQDRHPHPASPVGLIIFSFSLRPRWRPGSLEMDFWPVIISGFVQGLGMGLVFMPLNSLAFATLSQ